MATLSEADQREIRDLISRYCWAVDTGNGDALADTYTPEGVFVRSSGPEVRGRDELRKLVGVLSGAPYGRQHWVTNVVLEGDGATATGKAYIMVYRLDEGQVVHTLMGSYDDQLVKVDGRWLFQRRQAHRWPMAPKP